MPIEKTREEGAAANSVEQFVTTRGPVRKRVFIQGFREGCGLHGKAIHYRFERLKILKTTVGHDLIHMRHSEVIMKVN